MKFNFRKISAIAASAIMFGMTVGVATAASFPAPFSSSTSAGVAVVTGTGTGVDDLTARSSIADYLATQVRSITVPEGSWEVGTSSDDLEMTESIRDVETYIDDTDLTLLADGIISNEKGDAEYEQFFYFEDTVSSSVVYTEDDDSNIGLFFKINDDAVIARYVMDFTTNLESDIETDNELSDIEDKDITILGKAYTITTANNGSSGVELTLMSGAAKGTVNNDESVTVGGKTVSVLVSSGTAAAFTVDGETTDKLNKGETVKLSDGTYLGVTDITYQSFAGGIMQATFHLGADKIEMNSGSSLKVNAETIGSAAVSITSTESGGDISISEISINMTAEDDLYVPVDGKLSQVANLDEPEVLLTQNWDIEFKGLESVNTEEVTLKSSNSDKQYTLKFKNYNGDIIELPVVYATSAGLKGGKYDTANKDLLVLNASSTITDEDYFILNTAAPASSTTDARSFVIQYKSADKVTDDNPKVTFDILGVETGREESLATDGTFNTRLGGHTFNFANASSAASDHFNITLSDTQLGYVFNSTGADDGYIQMRTQYNALITITDVVVGDTTSNWKVNVSVDDQDRDGDEVPLSTTQNIFAVTLSNATSSLEVSTGSVSSSGTFLTNPDNDDETLTRTTYGAYVSVVDTTTSPAQITATIPESIVRPLVYVTTGGVAAATTAGSMVFTADETASWQSRDVILVGGSCINSATATALGVTYPTCEAAFTTATGVGSGQYLIQSVGDAFTSGKIALVVAGYSKADTTAAASRLVNQPSTVDTTAGNKYLGIVGASGTSTITKVA